MPGDERTPQASILSEVPPALLDGEMEVLGQMPGASNATMLVRCAGGADEIWAIYKPMRGESPLWDFPPGTLHRREVAAYEVARALGWPNVPATVLREGPNGPGSLQRFVRFDASQHYFTLEAEHADTFRSVAVFDLVINNADRKAGHCLIDEDGVIWLIDHGVCFSARPNLRTVIWDFIGEPLPERGVVDMQRTLADLRPGGGLHGRLAALLDADEVEATSDRIRSLLAAGVFPEPDPSTRPFPLPPI